MNEKAKGTIHWSFWGILIFLFVWNAMGCINFVVQMNPEMISSYPKEEQAIINGRPIWATIGFAIGVFGGAIGCLLLMLKKQYATYSFYASLLGIVITQAHSLSLGINFGIGKMVGIVFLPIVIAVFLIWYAKFVSNKGWLAT